MILGLEIAMLIGGVLALVTGKIKLSQNTVTEGVAARLAGAVFLLPLPLAFTIGFVVGATRVSRGQPAGGLDWTLVAMEAGVVLGCLVVALVIAFVGAKPPAPKRRSKRREEDFDDEDDEPRRDRRVRPGRPPEPGDREERVRRRSEREDY